MRSLNRVKSFRGPNRNFVTRGCFWQWREWTFYERLTFWIADCGFFFFFWSSKPPLPTLCLRSIESLCGFAGNVRSNRWVKKPFPGATYLFLEFLDENSRSLRKLSARLEMRAFNRDSDSNRAPTWICGPRCCCYVLGRPLYIRKKKK